MMLSKKKDRKNYLSTVKKNSAKIINLNNTDKKTTGKTKKEDKHISPPINKFNSGYLKARDNDPL